MTNALAYNDAVQYELLPQLYIAGCLRQTAVELQNFRCSYTISEDRLKTFFGLFHLLFSFHKHTTNNWEDLHWWENGSVS